jgi:uncharacterized protein
MSVAWERASWSTPRVFERSRAARSLGVAPEHRSAECIAARRPEELRVAAWYDCDVRAEPTNTLPDGVRAMWLCEDLIGAVILVAISFGIGAAADALMPWLALLAGAGGLAHVVLIPRERHRRYRWELREEELDLLEGVLKVTRTIVPITRIQHVSVERTGWTSVFDLVRLNVHTAAGKTTIPGLDPVRADDVRDRVLARLRTPDDL